MVTTGAPRTRATSSRITGGNPAPLHFGVEHGYPFSLVRRLALVFAGVLAFFVIGAWVLAQPISPVTILVHWMPVAAAILVSLYVVELIGVTQRPLPPITAETLFWAIATSCIVMAIGYSIASTYPPSAMLVCLAPIVSALCIYLQRKWIEQRGYDDISLATVVYAASRSSAARALAELSKLAYVKVTTLAMPADVANREPVVGHEVVTPDAILGRIRPDKVRLLIVADVDSSEVSPILAPCAGAGCVVDRLDDLLARTQGRVNLEGVDEVKLLNRLTAQAHRFSFQRALDLLFVAVLALPLGFVSLFVAVAVKLTSKGPVLFRQARVGRFGREFDILKFRTMRVDAEKETGPVFASENDPRITRIGHFLRRTRLDEIPQLVNVLKGDMSLVGPRPERPYFVRNLGRNIAYYDARHAVRPGLTGWAQVRYQYGSDDEDARNKLSYEFYYILHRSVVFYFAVLMETVKVVLFQRGSR